VVVYNVSLISISNTTAVQL